LTPSLQSTLFIFLKLGQWPELPQTLFLETVPQNLLLHFTYFSKLHIIFVINWASGQNNYIATVMVAIRVTVLIGATIKVAASKVAEGLLSFN